MHSLYIIFSDKLNRFYVGEGTNPKERLQQHNSHYFKTNFTKISNDWRLVLVFECKNRKEALYLESFIKRMKSRKFIEKVILVQTILQSILSKR